MNNITECNTSELITINVTTTTLNQYDITLSEFFIINKIYKLEKIKSEQDLSVSFFNKHYPTEFSTRRKARYAINNLVEAGFLTMWDKKSHTLHYNTTDLGKEVCATAAYILDYSREDYFMASQVIDVWNGIPQTSNHKLNRYGVVQTKTVHNIIHYIRDITTGDVKWYEVPEGFKLSLPQILSVIESYTLRHSKEYLPENKEFLPKSMAVFFLHYSKNRSEFFDICFNGVKKNTKTIDLLKATTISLAVLKKAYDTLSVTGVATEAEKLDIQKNIIRTHTRWVKHREMLDDIYSWKRSYREHVMDFNIFLNEIIAYVGKECGKGRAKSGFISFRQGNKLMEGFSKSFADSYHIFLWPTDKQKEHIIESRK